MTTLPAVMGSLQSFDEDAWDDLLNYIEERRVIPIIGPDLLRVQTDRGLRPLYEWLAEKLAARLSVDIGRTAATADAQRRDVLLPRPARPPRGSVHAPALDHARSGVRAAAGVAAAGADHRFRSVRHHHVRSAARKRDQSRTLWRPAGGRGHRVCAQSRRRPAGRTQPAAAHAWSITCSAGFPLRRRMSLSDEDMLEFICALQSEHLTPEKLFHELEHNHLLLIGSDFSNWLARLFLRMAKRKRLVRSARCHAKCSPTTTPCRTGGWWRSCSRSACARASTAAPKRSSPNCTRAGASASVRRRQPTVRQRTAALPAAGARDAGERDLHQLRARGPARRAASEGRAGRCRIHHLVRSRPPRRRRRLRPQDPRQHRALQFLRAGDLGDDAAPARSLFPPRMELRGRSRAQHRRRRAYSSCRCASTTRRNPQRWCRSSFKALHIVRMPGGEPPPEFLRRLTDLFSGRHA